ncbi:MAG: D-alanyl-D-alanine carboxypeptidase family protein [Opitutaceae bacterium]
MNFSRFLFAILCPIIALSIPADASAATRKKVAKEAVAHDFKGAIVMDAASGAVLFEENPDIKNPPASMTKLMTFAVLCDRLRAGNITLETPVTITAADSKIGGTQVWLKEGEVFPVEELIYAMMIQSANDAAYALARATAGSSAAFVDLMNAKARELGMTNTSFNTPHGLPSRSREASEGDLSSPRDFAILSRYLLLNTDILKYTSVRSRPFGSPQRVIPVAMVNHNHLLTKVAGVDGLKTGFTNGAGFCLTATAERNHRRIIVVMMGCPDKKIRDLNVAELLERGFANLPVGGPAFVAGGSPKTINETSPLSRAPLSPAEQEQAASAPGAAGEAPMIKLNIPPARKGSK